MSTFGLVGDASRALGAKVRHTVDGYRHLHDDDRSGGAETRKERYEELVNAYYDLVTDFYERGWGQSFHFGAPYRGEPYRQSILRHELYLAHRLGLARDARVLDVGCGVGGPARNIARFADVRVTGLNNNAYQVERARTLAEEDGLSERCTFVKGDFMKLPFDDATFDAAYEIEATCHAPDLVAVYSEIARVLRPGGVFGGYEWCLTSAYDPANPEHRAVKKEIEIGNGLPDIRTTEDVRHALAAAGFAIVETSDHTLRADPATPWYREIEGGFDSLTRIRRSDVGRAVIKALVTALEATKIAPAGTIHVSETLHVGADALVRGGKLGIFTPMFFTLARKES